MGRLGCANGEERRHCCRGFRSKMNDLRRFRVSQIEYDHATYGDVSI